MHVSATAFARRHQDDIDEVLAALDDVLERLRQLPVDELDDRQLAARVVAERAALDQLEALSLASIGAMDRRKAWRANIGIFSTEDFLQARCRMSRSSARDKAQLARRLDVLPATKQALGSGGVSVDEAREISKVAAVPTSIAPKKIAEAESGLLEMAEQGAPVSTLRDQADKARQKTLDDVAEDETAARRAARRGRVHPTGDGMVELFARFDPVTGAMVLSRVDAQVDRDRGKHDPRSREQQYADAIAALITGGGGATGKVRGKARGGDGASADGDCYSDAPVAHVTVVCDATTLAGGDGPPAEIADTGQLIGQRLLDQLTCDATVMRVVLDGRDRVLSASADVRIVPPWLRRVVRARDRGCVICGSRRQLVYHHIVHWKHGGMTVADNVVTLCRFHHDRLHDDKLTVIKIAGAWQYAPATATPERAPP